MSAQRPQSSNARSQVPDQDGLIVCFADAVRDTALRGVLKQDPVVADIVPLPGLGQALQADPDRTALLIYDTPVSYVGQRMTARIAPEAALKEWQTAAAALVEVLRRHRDRITLISVDMALHYPGVLAARLGLDPAAAAALKHAPGPAPDPVLRVLAGNALRQDMTAQALAGELEARASNLSNRDAPAASEGSDAFMHYLARQAEFDEAKAEGLNQALYAEEMFAQLGDVQAENAALTDKIERMRQRQAEFDSELGRNAQTITALEEAQKAMMQQLDHAQQDLESTYAEVRKVTAERDSSQHDIKSLEQEKAAISRKLIEVETWVHGIQASRSYRIMHPLRRLRTIMKRGG